MIFIRFKNIIITKYLLSLIEIWKNDERRTELNDEFERLAPIYFQYERESNRSHEISADLKKTFLNGSISNDNETLNGLIEVCDRNINLRFILIYIFKQCSFMRTA